MFSRASSSFLAKLVSINKTNYGFRRKKGSNAFKLHTIHHRQNLKMYYDTWKKKKKKIISDSPIIAECNSTTDTASIAAVFIVGFRGCVGREFASVGAKLFSAAFTPVYAAPAKRPSLHALKLRTVKTRTKTNADCFRSSQRNSCDFSVFLS